MLEQMKSEETLEDQLHQQYAENDNNRIGVFTSFIIGIIALFGLYGYVFVNTNSREYWNFNSLEYLLMSFITIGILFFLALLALYFGYSLRRDQIIINNIRKNRYKDDEKMKKIFKKLYNPHDKDYFNFLPDFYNLFFWLFFSSEIFLHITAILKIIEIEKSGILISKCIVFSFFLFHIVFIALTLIIRCCYLNKYKKISQ